MPIANVSGFILPIFEVEPFQVNDAKVFYPRIFRGTGFIIARNLFVTCWHCVNPIGDDFQYAVWIERGLRNYDAVFLDNINQDSNGSDLATANLRNGQHNSPLTIATRRASTGDRVWTCGYPDTIVSDRDTEISKRKGFIIERYFETYITRLFYYDHRSHGRVPSYELAMTAPRGLSGAPVIKFGSGEVRSMEVVGVIYDNHDAAAIEHFSYIDPDTGERMPETQRVISYAIAHLTDTLWDLRGPATQELPLSEYVLSH